MSPRTRDGYHGANRHRQFMAAAESISAKIAAIRGVVGILGTGCIGRGHCDAYSDLDLVVYAHGARVKDIGSYIAVGGMRYKGIELDTPVESYERALSRRSPSRYWSQVRRWDRENSVILHDTRNRIRDLLRAKLVFPERERHNIMTRQGEKIADRLVYEFALWEKRGGPINLARVLMQAVEHIVLWIYAMNRKFQPYPDKWLFYHLETGAVPEARYLPVLVRPFTGAVASVAEARAIRNDLMALADRLGIELEYRSVEELRSEEEAKYRRASDKTRRYLSW